MSRLVPYAGYDPGERHDRPTPRPRAPKGPVTLAAITKAVAGRYGVSTGEILSPSRERRFAEPRHIAIYLGRSLKGAKYRELSAHFRRDSGSIANAINVVETRLHGALFRETLARLRAEIEAASTPSGTNPAPQEKEKAHV